MTHKTCLVVGGTSGLGLSLAKRLQENSGDVIIAGRTDRHGPVGLSFKALDLGASFITDELTAFCSDLPPLDTVVIAAGYYQEGTLSDLSDHDISHMIQVGLTAPTLLLQRILKKQATLENLVTITSTSQFTPRAKEPVYTAIKSGMAMLSNSLAESGQIKKTLVAAPGGMRTAFWDADGRDTSSMLGPEWVADRIIEQFRANDYTYKFIKIFRGASAAEIAEQRPPQP